MMKIVDCWLERTAFLEKDLIRDNTRKILFVGRSNVGKSSLINKLLNRKRLARTSSTPGKTVSINYYRVHSLNNENGVKHSFYFVDLPGYGYAKISRQESQRVKSLLSTFFRAVENARLVLLLIDSRRGFMEADLEIVSQILDKKINILTVLTKSDKLPSSGLTDRKKALQNKFDLNVIAFTIKSNDSKEELLKFINRALTE
ncbi:MAG: YihA family ribosome biogenesis GTP-binding protein [Candidatus Aminicenantes bacterium]|nr:MAG: YihA family ribosome biogenesis GTP-binding protein [Candidatus Aminicenantes bacterium]